jgi:hypothetical protein
MITVRSGLTWMKNIQRNVESEIICPLNNGLLCFSFARDMLCFFLKFFGCFLNQFFFASVNLTKFSHFPINIFSKKFISQN